MPLFSIITACFNSAKTIENTIQSVTMQNCASYEHLFLDGGSTDGTLGVIKNFANQNAVIFSESDRGIYDAMNKGIQKAKGEWLCFLNSDDAFFDENVLSKVEQAILRDPSLDFVYGKALILDPGRPERISGRPILDGDYRFGVVPVVHQAMFFRKSLFDKYGLYDLSIQGAASDWVWLARYFHSKPRSLKFLDQMLIRYSMGGASTKNVWGSYMARMKLAFELFPMQIRLRYLLGLPMHALRFRVLQLHRDTVFRRSWRRIKSFLFR